MFRIATATIAAAFLLASPGRSEAQEPVDQSACGDTHVAGDWRLALRFTEDSFEGNTLQYHFTHQPSGFRLIMRVIRGEGVRFGFDVARLLETDGIKAYFEDMPTEPYDPDDPFPPDYLGEFGFNVVDAEQGWIWRSTGELAYGFDPFVGDANWIFSTGVEQEQIRSLVRNLTTRNSDGMELQLEFTPDGGNVQVLRRLTVSTADLVDLSDRSAGFVQAIMQRCPLAGGGN